MTIKITVSAPAGRQTRINGMQAQEDNGVFMAEILIDGYRLGADDVIWCFENIYKHQDEYTYIFDDLFLKRYNDLHDQYGTYIHMHVYSSTTTRASIFLCSRKV